MLLKHFACINSHLIPILNSGQGRLSRPFYSPKNMEEAAREADGSKGWCMCSARRGPRVDCWHCRNCLSTLPGAASSISRCGPKIKMEAGLGRGSAAGHIPAVQGPGSITIGDTCPSHSRVRSARIQAPARRHGPGMHSLCCGPYTVWSGTREAS